MPKASQQNEQRLTSDQLVDEVAERCVIGSVLIDPEGLKGVIYELETDAFYLLRHRLIWQSIRKLSTEGKPPDMLVLSAEMKEVGTLNDIGGFAYLTDCMNATPNHTRAAYYANIIQRLWSRRKIAAAAAQVAALATVNKPIEDIIAEASRLMSEVLVNPTRARVTPIIEALRDYYDKIEALVLTGKPIFRGLPTGYTDLDLIIGGLAPGELTTVAGRPGMGKSALLLCIIIQMLKLMPDKVILFVSLEMDIDQIAGRLIAMEANINVADLRRGKISAGAQFSRFVKGAGDASTLNLAFARATDMSPNALRSTINEAQLMYGRVDLVVVDYLQLMQGDGSFKASERVQEVSYITRQLKNMAGDYSVPILTAAQLSRAVDNRADKRPILSDLRESGSIEQDSDVVIFLYRDEVYNGETEFPNQAEVIVAKHRNGPTGTAYLYFEKTLTRFMNAINRTVDLTQL